MGTAIIKEKSAAAFLDTPTKRAPPIVDPLRENPGHKDKNWKKPIRVACFTVILSTSWTRYSSRPLI